MNPSDRDDALQEAALARLEGRSALRAVNRYRWRRSQIAKREHQLVFTRNGVVARNEDGRIEDPVSDWKGHAYGYWQEGQRDDC